MSSKEQDIKKQLEQQREQRQKVEHEQALLVRQETARLAQLPQSQQQQAEETQALDATLPVVIKPVVSDAAKGDWHKILSAYRELYPESAVKDNCLIFTSQQDALTFFNNQAKSSHTFFVQEFTNDKASGFHFYACGNGVLYSGSIDDIHQQLQRAQQDNPSAQVNEGLAFITKQMVANPTTNFRSALNGQREELADEVNAAKHVTSSTKAAN